MADLNHFDATSVEPATGFDALAAGRYPVAVVASDLKPTKAGDGEYLELEFEVLDGPFRGRKLWDRLVLEHPNPLTVKIARSKLSALCRAVGVLTPKDSVELHNLPLVAKVRVKRRADIDELTNEIAAYEKQEVLAGVPQQAANNSPPWRR